MTKYQEALAKMFKQYENIDPFEPVLGVVIEGFPNLRISIYSGQVILGIDKLYMNDRLFDDYTRTYKLEGQITEYDFQNTTDTEIASNHTHPIKTLKGKGTYKAEGTFINTDTLKVGDLVKVTPTENGQMWFIDYKVRFLGGGK